MSGKPRTRHASLVLGATLLALAGMAGIAAAGETESLTVEEYIEQARPYLHLSCAGAWAEANGDEDAYIDVVNKLTAIPLINHEFDIKKLEALPRPELEEVRAGYYNEIGRLCGENPKTLLAGVVEGALVRAFSRIDSDAAMK